MEEFKPGHYRHFKGGEYEALYLAKDSETQEPMVVYRALYGAHLVWVRPLSMWNETVERDGYKGPRFVYVGEAKAPAKKIIVIGAPGAGKSTFSRALREKLNLPLVHMDMLYWNSDGTSVTSEELRARVEAEIERPEWIIDGNYQKTMELRLKSCDRAIFLDYPENVCIEGIKARIGTNRADLPWVETKVDEDFLTYVKNFHKEQIP